MKTEERAQRVQPERREVVPEDKEKAPSSPLGALERKFMSKLSIPLKGKDVNPTIRNVASEWHTPHIPTQAIVPDLLYEGAGLLTGDPKARKTWLAFDLAIAKATGGMFLGRQVEAGPVLYLALQSSESQLFERMKLLADVAPDIDYVSAQEGWPRFDGGGLEAIGDWLQRKPAGALVIVDMWVDVEPQRKRGENIYTVQYAQMQAVSQLAHTHKAAILLLHHTNRANTKDPIRTISGSNGFVGGADTLWVLQEGQSERATLHIKGRAETVPLVPLRLNGPCWEVNEVEVAPTVVALSPERQAVLGLLVEGKMHYRSIMERLHISEGVAKKRMHDMRKAGQVEGDGTGYYWLPSSEVDVRPRIEKPYPFEQDRVTGLWRGGAISLKKRIVGYELENAAIFWNGSKIDLLRKQQVSGEAAEWLQARGVAIVTSGEYASLSLSGGNWAEVEAMRETYTPPTVAMREEAV